PTQAVPERFVQDGTEGLVGLRHERFGLGRRTAPYDAVQVLALRLRQGGQRSLRRESFEGPSRLGPDGAHGGQDGMLVVVTLDAARPGTVRLNRKRAADVLVANLKPDPRAVDM